MFEFFSSPEFASQMVALGQVLMIDLVLAGDNAVAVGLAAAALPPSTRSIISTWPRATIWLANSGEEKNSNIRPL